MDKIVQAFVGWCARKDAAALIEHTVVEGVLGVAVTAVGQIPEPYSLYVVPLSMAILTPVIAAIGNGGSPTTTATPAVTAETSAAPVSTATVTETAPVATTETAPIATVADATTTTASDGTAADGKGE